MTIEYEGDIVTVTAPKFVLYPTLEATIASFGPEVDGFLKLIEENGRSVFIPK